MFHRNTCEFCSNPLPSGSKAGTRFCSAACKQAAYRRRVDPEVGTIHREAERISKAIQTKQATLTDRTCVQCGGEFAISLTQASAEYCSAACKQKAYRQRQRSDEQTPAPTPTQAAGRVTDPDTLRGSGIHNRRMLAKQRGDLVTLIKTGHYQDAHLGKVIGTPLKHEPAPQYHVWVEFEVYSGIVRHIIYEGDLEIVLFNCDGGPRGIQQLVERVSVAYQQRYGFNWIYGGGKVEAKADGYYLRVGETTYYLHNHQQAKNHLTEYFLRGVSNQAMLRAR